MFIKSAINYTCYFVSHNLVAIVLRINSVLVLVLVLVLACQVLVLVLVLGPLVLVLVGLLVLAC